MEVQLVHGNLLKSHPPARSGAEMPGICLTGLPYHVAWVTVEVIVPRQSIFSPDFIS